MAWRPSQLDPPPTRLDPPFRRPPAPPGPTPTRPRWPWRRRGSGQSWCRRGRWRKRSGSGSCRPIWNKIHGFKIIAHPRNVLTCSLLYTFFWVKNVKMTNLLVASPAMSSLLQSELSLGSSESKTTHRREDSIRSSERRLRGPVFY